jgi:hypothetical protein
MSAHDLSGRADAITEVTTQTPLVVCAPPYLAPDRRGNTVTRAFPNAAITSAMLDTLPLVTPPEVVTAQAPQPPGSRAPPIQACATGIGRSSVPRLVAVRTPRVCVR